MLMRQSAAPRILLLHQSAVHAISGHAIGIPEPARAMLLLTGVLALALTRRRAT